ncbi:MAG: tetratricopeptide repeat protein, partial [Myxococcaceae bacterium]
AAAQAWLAVTGGQDLAAQAYLSGGAPFTARVDSADGWYEKGVGETSSQRHAEAAIAYRVALSRNEGMVNAWNNLGWSLLSLGFLDEAEPAFERALTLDPDFELARNNLAETRARNARAAP